MTITEQFRELNRLAQQPLDVKHHSTHSSWSPEADSGYQQYVKLRMELEANYPKAFDWWNRKKLI